MQNYQVFKIQLKQRIENGTVTQEDLDLLAKAAKKVNAIHDRVLYSQANEAYKAQQEKKQMEQEQAE